MDEHTALVDRADHIRRSLVSGSPGTAMSGLTDLVAHLRRHVRREEDGIFRALRDAGEFVDEIDALQEQHRAFETAIAELSADASDFETAATHLLDDLEAHVMREDYGIFPVSVVTLGATGWATVDQAHTKSPSFLHDQPTTTAPPS